jgi:hypothetical protein
MMSHGQRIEAHYREFWGAPEARLALGIGPADHIRELPRGFEILLFRKTSTPGYATPRVYATCCMSETADPEGLELHLLVRDQDGERATVSILETLTAVAHFHRTGSPLGMGHTVNFGRGYLPGSTCTHGLLSLPYLDGPRLEWLEAPRVRFLWLIPVTLREVEFKKSHGLDALEERLESARFDYLDPQRASVC